MSGVIYIMHGATLALACWFVLNLAAAGVVAFLAARMIGDEPAAAANHRFFLRALLALRSSSFRRRWPGSPAFWLSVRLFPAALSIAFVALVFLPSYWKYEPREMVEGFDVSLTTLAILGVALLATAAARGARAWQQASRRTAAWLRLARPLPLPGTSMPAYEIDVDAPIMALVGVLRPRLLITRGVLNALTGEELAAGVAHEIRHWRAWDNLKRLAMRASPDFLYASAAARAIEARWASAAEQAADRLACSDARARCALASALVKVARLTPPNTHVAGPISTLVDGDDIALRVQCLLEDGEPQSSRRAVTRLWLAIALPPLVLAAAYSPLLRIVHLATEVLVRTLP
jgi:Zn-dependent protease with chaperone function